MSKLVESKCPYCNNDFERLAVGRYSKVCPTCYPLYRRAYNLLTAAKFRARKRNLTFNLDLGWILDRLKKDCEVTHLSFELKFIGKNYQDRHPTAPSIDRIDPDKGYTKDNCRMVIWWFNCAKQRYSDLGVLHLCGQVVRSLGEKLALNV